MTVSPLEKVLRLSAQPLAAAPSSSLVAEAADDLNRIALLLAQQADDDEDDDEDDDTGSAGDDDDEDDGKGSAGSHSGHATFKAMVRKKVNPKLAARMCAKADAKAGRVKASRELVMDAMLALSALQGGEIVTLSVLTAAERRKPGAHTIPGSEDFPIPDKSHLAAARARYKAGMLAGHSKEEVARHIRSRARALGEDASDLDGGGDGKVAATAAASAVLALARGDDPRAPGQGMAPMEHGPFEGKHSHPHRVVEVHDHPHFHNGDSRHSCGAGSMPGSIY